MIYGSRHMIYAPRMIYADDSRLSRHRLHIVDKVRLGDGAKLRSSAYFCSVPNTHFCSLNEKTHSLIRRRNTSRNGGENFECRARHKALCAMPSATAFYAQSLAPFSPSAKNCACSNIVRNHIAVRLFSQWGYPCVSLGIFALNYERVLVRTCFFEDGTRAATAARTSSAELDEQYKRLCALYFA